MLFFLLFSLTLLFLFLKEKKRGPRGLTIYKGHHHQVFHIIIISTKVSYIASAHTGMPRLAPNALPRFVHNIERDDAKTYSTKHFPFHWLSCSTWMFTRRLFCSLKKKKRRDIWSNAAMRRGSPQTLAWILASNYVSFHLFYRVFQTFHFARYFESKKDSHLADKSSPCLRERSRNYIAMNRNFFFEGTEQNESGWSLHRNGSAGFIVADNSICDHGDGSSA